MDVAFLLAKIFGPLLAILGLWMLLYGKNLVKVLTATKHSPPALCVSDIASISIGLVILNLYNVWSRDLFVLVTLLGWYALIWGLLGLFVPQVIVRLFMSNNSWLKIMGIVPLIWGLALIFVGFYY